MWYKNMFFVLVAVVLMLGVFLNIQVEKKVDVENSLEQLEIKYGINSDDLEKLENDYKKSLAELATSQEDNKICLQSKDRYREEVVAANSVCQKKSIDEFYAGVYASCIALTNQVKASQIQKIEFCTGWVEGAMSNNAHNENYLRLRDYKVPDNFNPKLKRSNTDEGS